VLPPLAQPELVRPVRVETSPALDPPAAVAADDSQASADAVADSDAPAATAADAARPLEPAAVTAEVQPVADPGDERVCRGRVRALRQAAGSDFLLVPVAAQSAAEDEPERASAAVLAAPDQSADLPRAAATSAGRSCRSIVVSPDARPAAEEHSPESAKAPVRQEAVPRWRQRREFPAQAVEPARTAVPVPRPGQLPPLGRPRALVREEAQESVRVRSRSASAVRWVPV
jgi:nicotinate-nucleotide--dimethylbenzimidazole phosphoribosyltransferase